jgi:hypothetical protein
MIAIELGNIVHLHIILDPVSEAVTWFSGILYVAGGILTCDDQQVDSRCIRP